MHVFKVKNQRDQKAYVSKFVQSVPPDTDTKGTGEQLHFPATRNVIENVPLHTCVPVCCVYMFPEGKHSTIHFLDFFPTIP